MLETDSLLPANLLGQKNTPYEVRCSCPYQRVVGVPCHHFSLFLQVLPKHINVRYHNSLDALWRREGFEDRQDHFRKRLCSNRLIITYEEYNEIIGTARRMSSPMSMFCVDSSVPVQNNKNGMLTSLSITTRRAGLSKAAVMQEDTFNQGDLTEDLHHLQGEEEEESWGNVVSPSTQPTFSPVTGPSARMGSMMNELAEAYKEDPVALAKAEEEVAGVFHKLMARAPPCAGQKSKPPGKLRGLVGMKSHKFLKGRIYIRMKRDLHPHEEFL